MGSSMGPRRVIEGQAAEVKRRERWEAAVKRRKSSRRNVGLLAVSWEKFTFILNQSFTARER